MHQLAPTGVINYLNENNSINVYPNPSTNNITIESHGQSRIEVSNIEGRLINSVVSCGNKTKVDISGLQSGIYLVKVKSEEGMEVGKFVKE